MSWPQGAHGNTFGGNPISCAAALATIQLLEDELIENAAKVGAYTLDCLAEIQARHPSLGEVRGKGLMIGVEFVKDKTTKERAPDIRDETIHEAFMRGLLLLGCGRNTVRLTPPLTVTTAEVDEALAIFEEALTAAETAILG